LQVAIHTCTSQQTLLVLQVPELLLLCWSPVLSWWCRLQAVAERSAAAAAAPVDLRASAAVLLVVPRHLRSLKLLVLALLLLA
jgi:hypothetical protein